MAIMIVPGFQQNEKGQNLFARRMAIYRIPWVTIRDIFEGVTSYLSAARGGAPS